MSAMLPEWLDAYGAGIFTEFQEQRAPGHTVAGDKIYRMGLLEFIDEIHQSKRIKSDPDQLEELQAMEIAARAIIDFADRYAVALDSLAEIEKDQVRKSELENMAGVCRRVPAHKPRTLHEALQYYWFIHLGVITELNPWDSYNPGRLDQHLLPFYQRDIEEGRLTKENAKELLQAFWIKFNNQPAPPKMGVTALESNTYTDFCLINLGGLTPDGEDAVNEMSYLLLDVIEEMRLLQPSSMIQVSQKNPDAFVKRALKIIKSGFGQPSVFNTDAIIQELLRQGKDIVDARKGGASGCVETGAFGVESYTLTGYFNLAKLVELTLHNGFDPRTQKQLGPRTGDPLSFSCFDDFLTAYNAQLNHFIDVKIEGNNRIEKINAQYMPVPFMSLFTDDCIQNGKDYNAGGARYNTSYIQGVGTGSTTDSLSSIKYHVYDRKTFSMEHLLEMLDKNYEGYPGEWNRIWNETPKYGNDEDYADELLAHLFEQFFRAVDGRPSFKGGTFRINLLPTTTHVYFGSVIGALPDGRKAGQPLSEGISPVQGADRKGPTAVLKSAGKIDHLRTGGTLLNQKFLPSFFEHERNYEKLTALIRAYFSMNGHHIQFNVVDADTLRDAQRHPENYRDLIVRVAGYSDYFNDLGEDLQNEIIARTEHC
jgi:formate C-acetyltransferase